MEILTLTPQFKYEAGIIIEGYVSRLKEKKPKDLFGVKRVIKYTNYKDFWHGYFLGKIEGQLLQAHFKEFKREMTESERIELDQIIALFDPMIQEAISNLK